MRAFFTSLVATLLILGCSDSNQSKSSVKKVEFQSPAWLQANLPANTSAYLRVPNPWFLLSGQDNGFEFALKNEAYINQVRDIQRSLDANLLSQLPAIPQQMARWLVKYADASFEIAFLSPDDGQAMPMVVFATSFSFSQGERFGDLFRSLTQQIPQMRISFDANSDNEGDIVSDTGVTARFKYDPNTTRFFLIGGLGSTPTGLDRVAQSIAIQQVHPLQKVQEKLDSSLEGLFLWLNPKLALKSVQGFMPAINELQALGIDQLDTFALGYGTSEGKARLKVIAEGPESGIRKIVPMANNNFSVYTRGEPNWAITLSLPSSSDLKEAEAHFGMDQNSNSPIRDIRELILQTTDITLEQWMDAIGPEFIIFSDNIDMFTAIRLNKADWLYKALNKLNSEEVLDYSTREVSGLTFHELVIDNSNAAFDNASAELDIDPVALQLINSLKSYVYWIEEDGFIIMSSIPQPLLERASNSNKILLSDWFTKTQRHDVSDALVSIGGSVKDLSRSAYHYHLQGMRVVADLTASNFNPYIFPTADKLGFNNNGTVAMSIHHSANSMAIEFVFEQSALDLLYAGPASTAAVVGILAAVAIPAYQDYTVRAQSSETVFELTPLQQEIEYRVMSGADVLNIKISEQEARQWVSIDGEVGVEDGSIFVVFSSNSDTEAFRGRYLILQPVVDSNGTIIDWSCDTSIDVKYAPAICR